MGSLGDMVQEFAMLCKRHPDDKVDKLFNHYMGQSPDPELLVKYTPWFIESGKAARDERSLL